MKKIYNNYEIIADENIYSVIKNSLVQKIKDSLSFKPFFSLALSGGNTPRRLYHLLSTEILPWDRVKIFPVDERVLPPGSDGLNWKMIEEEFLVYLQKRPHVFPHVDIHIDPQKASLLLEEVLRRELPLSDRGIPVIDLILLGTGSDGHCASIFPGSNAFGEEKKLVTFSEGPPPFDRRITFTFPLISSAGERWFLVTGHDKKEISGKIFKNIDRELPAARVSLSSRTIWFLDISSLPDFVK